LQREIDGQLLTDTNDQSRSGKGLKTGKLRLDRISAWVQCWKNVATVRARNDDAFEAIGVIGGGDVDTGQHGLALVGNRAVDFRAPTLGESRRGRDEKDEEPCKQHPAASDHCDHPPLAAAISLGDSAWIYIKSTKSIPFDYAVN